MRTSTRFNLQFLRLFKKKDTAESFILIFFSPQKLVRLFILKEVKPSLDRKMIKFTHLVTCSRHYDILAKSRRRMTTAITFSRKRTLAHALTILRGNLVLLVVLFLESTALSYSTKAFSGSPDWYNLPWLSCVGREI